MREVATLMVYQLYREHKEVEMVVHLQQVQQTVLEEEEEEEEVVVLVHMVVQV